MPVRVAHWLPDEWLSKSVIFSVAVADSRTLIALFAEAEVLACNSELSFPPMVKLRPDGDHEVVFFDDEGKKIIF